MCNVVAAGARSAGVHVIAVVSRFPRQAAQQGGGGSGNLLDLADVVVDNHGAVGDVDPRRWRAPPGRPDVHRRRSGDRQRHRRRDRPLLSDLGAPVGVLASSNVAGGDEHNEAMLAPFRDRVRAL